MRVLRRPLVYAHASRCASFSSSTQSSSWQVLRTPCGLGYARGTIGDTAAASRLRLLLTHGVGHGKELAWAPVLPTLSRLLASAGTAAEFIAFDFAGHGTSRAQGEEPQWDVDHGAEVASVLEHCSFASTHLPLVGVGCSMGGAVLVGHELRYADTFDHVIAIEPPLFTSGSAALINAVNAIGLNWMAQRVEGRRATWPSREAARAHVAKRSGRAWAESALDAFAAHGVHDAPDGDGVALACSPHTEASSIRWCSTPLQPLTAKYGGSCGFTIMACEGSDFSPVGFKGTGMRYYKYSVVPNLPRKPMADGSAQTTMVVLGEGATHGVGQEQPRLLAQAIVDEVCRRGLLSASERGRVRA